jgi:iron complex outermembrane recepter protein
MRDTTPLKSFLISGTAFAALATATPAFAQGTPPPATDAATQDDSQDADAGQEDGNNVLVTGSRIRQDPNNSALPLQIINLQELQRNSISSPEQLLMFLPSNGSGADNLASNSDVVSGAQRGTNGLSSANLRGQGNASTLILLNNRRVAAHGLSGSAVDVNQIPYAALERIEVLKDGASAIYGTDAIGGVINFITRTDYEGIGLSAFTDVTEQGDASIYRLSGIAGYGDLDEDGFNIMGAVSYSWNHLLHGSQRAFVNGNQPNRGLTIDTRGTPIATAFNIGANTFQQPNGTLLTGLTLTLPNGANGAAGGINILDLPGGAGCETMDGGMAYDEVLWAVPTAQYACAWDTGRATVLQQPINTLTYYGRGVVRISGDHRVSLEVTGSDADSAKSFSNAQLSANTTNLPIAYPRNALTAANYDAVFNAIRAAFDVPTNPNRAAQIAALDARFGRPISYRWRCIACGPRQYVTNTQTFRAALGLEGPLWGDWEYRAGASYARSESSSVLGTGYYFRGTLANGASDPLAPTAPGAPAPGLVGVMNSGLINPFSLTQTPEALAALQAVSAEGTTLYGGRYQTRQFDASISGSLFHIWGGDVQLAAGVDYRRETYEFNGSDAADAADPVIFLAAFDNVNALTPKRRRVLAAYAEALFPILPELDVIVAGRVDDYTGFGTTWNPKVSFRFRPWEPIMFRGSYGTGFRVPTFNQIFNGVTISPNPGNTLVDPTLCPQGTTAGPQPACAPITPESASGGNLNLEPETSEQYSLGVVIQPSSRFSLSVDYWNIAVDNTIGTITIPQLLANIAAFPERIQRTNGIITAVDLRTGNFGSRRTEGIDVSLRGAIDAFDGSIRVGLDGTYLLDKREKLLPSLPYTSTLGVFTFTGDLGLRWKHNAFISYQNEDWNVTLTQIFRNGYRNFALPDYNERVNDYIIYNFSIGYTGFAPGLRLTLGVRNIFDRDPPFAITYDSNTGAGGSWEPRVADPRGRSFTMAAEVNF